MVPQLDGAGATLHVAPPSEVEASSNVRAPAGADGYAARQRSVSPHDTSSTPGPGRIEAGAGDTVQVAPKSVDRRTCSEMSPPPGAAADPGTVIAMHEPFLAQRSSHTPPLAVDGTDDDADQEPPPSVVEINVPNEGAFEPELAPST